MKCNICSGALLFSLLIASSGCTGPIPSESVDDVYSCAIDSAEKGSISTKSGEMHDEPKKNEPIDLQSYVNHTSNGICISTHSYFYGEGQSLELVNDLMKQYEFPFTLESYRKKDRKKDILKYAHKIEVFSVDYYSQEYVASVESFEESNSTKYIVTISEDVVGLDYLIIIDSTDSSMYVSDKFNENCEQYKIIEINSSNLLIRYESGKNARVRLSPFQIDGK